MHLQRDLTVERQCLRGGIPVVVVVVSTVLACEREDRSFERHWIRVRYSSGHWAGIISIRT